MRKEDWLVEAALKTGLRMDPMHVQPSHSFSKTRSTLIVAKPGARWTWSSIEVDLRSTRVLRTTSTTSFCQRTTPEAQNKDDCERQHLIPHFARCTARFDDSTILD